MQRNLFRQAALTASLVASMAPCLLQAQDSELHYLSGRGVDDTKTWRFKCTDGQRAGKWASIQVPSQWELQGFGDYTYGRWYVDKNVTAPSHEEGDYTTTFAAPASWRGQRVVLWFDGVMTDTEVQVNGQSAGPMHQGGFYRFGYDITALVQPGKKNTLSVHVAKHSANKSINAAERKADWWLFGGIYRPVWLEITPTTAISHVAVDARADGSLTASVETVGETSGYTLSAQVTSLDGSLVLGKTSGVGLENRIVRSVGLTAADSARLSSLSLTCANAQPWTCEQPNLYQLQVSLHDASGKEVHRTTTRIGFRTIEFRPHDGLYLNGTRLIVKGVNRHSFWPEGGRTTSAALSLQDAKLIKGMNMNAVRSHYPPDEHFLNVCDSLGILYLDELAGWQNNYDTEVGSRLLEEMIRRDVNHPCIFLWSNGNEGGWNTQLDAHFADYDPQHRHVIHPWADFDQLDAHHYPAYLTGVGRFNNGSNVFMPTEFMHALYDQGGGAGLADFWNKWLTSPLFAGGFIWAFCDESVARSDKGGILDSDRSNAPDGIVGPHREKEGSYYAIREVWSPIQVKPLRITESFDGSLYVTNGYLFNDLSHCRLAYRLESCPSPLSADAASLRTEVMENGSIDLPAIEPGETRRVQLSLPHLQAADVLTLDAIDYNGDTVSTVSFPVHTPEVYLQRQLAMHPSTLQMEHPEVRRSGGEVILSNSRMTVRFSDETGCILSMEKDGRTSQLTGGPVAVGMKAQYRPDRSSLRVEGEDAVFVARYDGGVDSIEWRLTHDAALSMDALLLTRAGGSGGFDDAFSDSRVYNLGLTFNYPEAACGGVTWLGRGPYRVWKNRLPGTNYGVWHKEANNTITGESTGLLTYPEFKGYHANLYWAQLLPAKAKTADAKTSKKKNATNADAASDDPAFTIYCASENVYFRLFTPEEPAGRADGKPTMPAFPEGDISFLLDIPAIQSFKPIEQQGPQSQPGNIRIKKGDAGLRIKISFQ
jgi:beta-galactosidase/beta-glucuronidase